MNKYRIKFSYEKILGGTKQSDFDIETCGFVIAVSNGVAEVACIAKGNGIGEAMKSVGEALAEGREERLEKSLETLVMTKKSQGIEIRRINWVEEKK